MSHNRPVERFAPAFEGGSAHAVAWACHACAADRIPSCTEAF